jgi:phenylacetate-CoA ligase
VELEKWYRSKVKRLQLVYDRMPLFVRAALVTVRGLSLAMNRYARSTYEDLEQLKSHDRWSRQEIEQQQISNLQRIFDVARGCSPFYSGYPPLRLTSLSEWSQLPVISREIVREMGPAMLNVTIRERDRIWVATTGTTGAGLKVCYTPAVMRKNWAFRMQQFLWAGIRPRSPRITAFGSQVVSSRQKSPPYWVRNSAENQILVSIFHLSSSTAADYVAFLRQHANRVLEGFPSALGLLANFVLAAGAPIPMRAVFTDGEPLLPTLREMIESAFCTRVFNTYGNTELCGLIQQCEHQGMHLNSDYGFLEILDNDGRPVEKGETGYLVWTGFINDSMPLLRYRIGDRGAWLALQECPCGRKSALVDPGVSRESDLLYAADGRVFSPRAVNQVLKAATAFRFCQFVQRQKGHVLVRAVGGGMRAQQELSGVRQGIVSLLGASTTVEAELASEPIVTRGGKTPLVVRERN